MRSTITTTLSSFAVRIESLATFCCASVTFLSLYRLSFFTVSIASHKASSPSTNQTGNGLRLFFSITTSTFT